ncbi:hypothetical protein PG989_010719 [Apiospora arundinis]
MTHKQSSKTTQASGSKKSHKTATKTDSPVGSKADATKNHMKKTSSHKNKNKKKENIPEELMGVGAWTDDMPEQYQGSSAGTGLDL